MLSVSCCKSAYCSLFSFCWQWQSSATLGFGWAFL